MEGNTNGGTWTPKLQDQGMGGQSFDPSLIGTGEGESPLAKPQEKTDMRTMASDIASMQETGGSMPRPYTPQNVPQTTPQPAPRVNSLPPQNMATKETITPPNGMPPVIPPQKPSGVGPSGNAKPAKKGAFVGILVFIVIIGLAAVAYFFVYPMFKGTVPAAPVTESPVTPPASPNDTNAPLIPPATPPATSTAPTSTNPVTPSSTPVSVSTIELHASFFKNPADLVFDTKLSAFGASDLKQPLQFSPTSVPLLREIVWKTGDNKPLSFSAIAGTFFPSFFTPQFTDNFQSDSTVFSYTDNSGTWLGFVAKLKDGTDLGSVQGVMSPLQKSPDIAQFYLADPGTQGAWKDAKILNHPASVVPFSASGATFGYVWFDRYLIVTSNLSAATEAAHRLGY